MLQNTTKMLTAVTAALGSERCQREWVKFSVTRVHGLFEGRSLS